MYVMLLVILHFYLLTYMNNIYFKSDVSFPFYRGRKDREDDCIFFAQIS